MYIPKPSPDATSVLVWDQCSPQRVKVSGSTMPYQKLITVNWEIFVLKNFHVIIKKKQNFCMRAGPTKIF